MPITKFTVDVENVQGLNDRPNSNSGLTADQVKAVFDKAGEDIKNYINNTLTPEIDSNSGLNIGIINVLSYGAKGDGVTDDIAAIRLAAATSSTATLYFPDGTYMISSALSITNDVCLNLSANAVIKASTAMTDMINYNVTTTNNGKNRFIKGGILDGDEKATNVLNIVSAVELDLQGFTVKNAINRGLIVAAGYGVIANNLRFNNTVSTNLTDNIAMDIRTSDCVFRDINCMNFTVGMKLTGGGNIIDGFHPWVNQSGRLSSSVGVDNRAQANEISTSYLDTLATGIITDHRIDINNCIFNVNRAYRNLFSGQPVYINNNAANYININQCYFEYTNQGAETYHVTVISGNLGYGIFLNCDFATTSTLDNIPVMNRRNKEFKIRIDTSNWTTPAAGGFSEKDITITDPTISIAQRDTIDYNILGYFEDGLDLTISMKAANIVKVRLHNTTASAIPIANRTIFLTVKQNYDGSGLDFTQPTVTGNN